MANILIVDDEDNILYGLERAFSLEGYTTFVAKDGLDALNILKKETIDIMLSDLKMPNMDGHTLLKEALFLNSDLQVIIFTAHGSVEEAVNAMQNGAYNFLTKPLNLDHLFLIVKQALSRQSLQNQASFLRNELDKHIPKLDFIHFKSSSMITIYDKIEKSASSKASVLLLGQSGVGKEVVANAIHLLSNRKDKPLVKVHCAALSENILESELFGHEKGAFTGANVLHKGRFELADGGTIFLDEIGEINQSTQVKLLRVLQDRSFERLGGEKTIKVDVRIIAATNRNLEKEVAEGRFREDLYYRLNVINIVIPPLKERLEDIEFLSKLFLNEFSEENFKKIDKFDDEVWQYLLNYNWPGNVRQLRNCIESAVVMSNKNVITKNDLPSYLVSSATDSDDKIYFTLDLTLRELENKYMQAVLLKYKGNKSKASISLGLNRKTLQRKLGENGEYN